MPIPTQRLFWLFAVGLLPAAVVAIARLMQWPWDGLGLVLGWDGLVAGLALADATTRRRPGLQVGRRCPDVLSIGRSNPVSLELSCTGAEPLPVTLWDDAAPDVVAEGMPVTLELLPGQALALKYHLRPGRRGHFALGMVWARWPTRFGLWHHQRQYAVQQDTKVYPDLQVLRTYDLWLREARDERATRATRMRGGESEFERLREYTQDDDVRRIDWKATARRRSLICREYQLERDQNVVFALDMGRWMTADSAGLPQFDRALNAALMLAHVASRAGDHTGLLAFDTEVRAWLPPLGGPGATRRLIRASFDLEPSLLEPDFRAGLVGLRRRLKKRSLVVLFTQVLDPVRKDELVPLLRALQPVHLPIVVMLRDENLEAILQPGVGDAPEALYVKGAAAAEVTDRERMAEDMRRAGAIVVHVKPSELTSEVVRRYLEVKSRRLL